MPYYQMQLGNATRTYKAFSAGQVVALLEKHGCNMYRVVRVPKADYDSERAKDGDIVGDRMDLTKGRE